MRPILPLVLCLALVVAAPASARTLLGDLPEGARSDPRGVVVRPTELAWAFDDSDQEYGVYVKRAGAEPRRLRQFDALGRLVAPGVEGRPDIDVSLGVSDELVAVSVATHSYLDTEDGFPPTSRAGPSAVEVATRTGRARRLASCRRGTLDFVAVEGRTVAYVGAGCDNSHAGVAVHDLARGTKRTIRPPRGNGFGDLRLAGRYLAAVVVNGPRSGTIIVYDWRRGRALYSAPRNGFENQFALGRDGTLATLGSKASPGCDHGEVRWRSPASPRARAIPGVGCSNDVRVAGSRVLGSRLAAPQQPQDAPRTEHVVTDLRGGAPVALFENLDYGFGRAPVLWDGRHIGYSTPACDASERIVVDTLTELTANGPLPLETCTVAMDELPSEVRVKGRRTVALRGRCPLGCQAFLRFFDPSVGRTLQFGSFGAITLEAGRGRTETADSELSEADLERLVRAGRLDVELRVEVMQPDGTRVTRTRPLTLLPPA